MPASKRPGRRPTSPRLLAALALAVPLLAFGALEGGLRLFWHGADNPLFGTAVEGNGAYRVASRTIARRYFPDDERPPSPPHDLFAQDKPSRALRLFVMGESTTAGFPFPHNGTFSRVLADALHDVLPGDSIEVVNVGIAATNSYQMLDLIDEVIAERPDAVLVYAGHNEYYGALGSGSTVRLASSPALVRLYLRAMRWRTVALLDRAVRAVRRSISKAPPAGAPAIASFMETIAADQDIRLGTPQFAAGEHQFEGNLSLMLARLRAAKVPTFVASVASNVRDLPPFAAAGNDGADGARASWTAGQQLLARGDSVAAREALQRARDLDVVRFRAPSSFNDIIARTAKAQQATYVPVAEAFASASPAGLPGHELFLEHLHPTRDGVVLLARTFYESLRAQHFLGHEAREAALRPWDEYRARMALSPFDERIAAHTVASLTARWPFVAVAEQRDYRGTYRPVDAADSLALLTSRGGIAWEAAKLARIRAQFADSSFAAAVDEARGLVRDAPLQGTPWEVLGRALVGAGRPAEGDSALQRAFGLAPSAGTAFTIGVLALQAKRPTDGVTWLERSLRLDGNNPDAAYQLSLAYALSGDAVRARQLATALARRMPTYPGLAAWLQALGIAPPR